MAPPDKLTVTNNSNNPIHGGLYPWPLASTHEPLATLALEASQSRTLYLDPGLTGTWFLVAGDAAMTQPLAGVYLRWDDALEQQVSVVTNRKFSGGYLLIVNRDPE